VPLKFPKPNGIVSTTTAFSHVDFHPPFTLLQKAVEKTDQTYVKTFSSSGLHNFDVWS
jgi:hypothetical protein